MAGRNAVTPSRITSFTTGASAAAPSAVTEAGGVPGETTAAWGARAAQAAANGDRIRTRAVIPPRVRTSHCSEGMDVGRLDLGDQPAEQGKGGGPRLGHDAHGQVVEDPPARPPALHANDLSAHVHGRGPPPAESEIEGAAHRDRLLERHGEGALREVLGAADG